MLTVCHFSDWIEVDKLPDTLSTTIIDRTKAHFARYGIPKICHTDNGPQFISKDYHDFASNLSFKHTTSSPYHPQGNGRAEAAVKVCKAMLKKSEDFHTAMLIYRNTPPKGHTYSPAQRMFYRRTRTPLPTSDQLLIPRSINIDTVVKEIKLKRQSSKENYDKKAGLDHAPIEVGSYAYAKPPPTKRGSPWSYGKVTHKDSARSYTIATETGKIRRNRIQVKPAAPPPAKGPTPTPLTVYTHVPVSPPSNSQSNVTSEDPSPIEIDPVPVNPEHPIHPRLNTVPTPDLNTITPSITSTPQLQSSSHAIHPEVIQAHQTLLSRSRSHNLHIRFRDYVMQ